MIRPEDFHIESNIGKESNGIVKSVDFLGPTQTICVELKSGELINVTDSPLVPRHVNESVKVSAKRVLFF